MLKGIAGACVVVCLLISPARGAEPFSIKDVPDEDAKMIVGVVAATVAAANARLLLDGKNPLYCRNDGFWSGGSELWALLNRKYTGPFNAKDIPILAIEILRATFPCQ